MNKKIIISLIIVLVIIVGGIFLWMNQGKEEIEEDDYISTPTEWSQEGDYIIQKTAEGIIVTNEKAGFSFKVPEGWKIEGEEGIVLGEYLLNMFSPDTEFREDKLGNKVALLKGCGISFNNFYQEDEVFYFNNLITHYNKNPEDVPENKEVIVVSNYLALKTSMISTDIRVLEKLGKIIQIRIPFSEKGLIEFGISIMPEHQTNCDLEFNEFISSFLIK